MKNKDQIKLLPKYIKLYEGGEHEANCAMRLLESFDNPDNIVYFRDAGEWELDCRIDGETNKLYSVHKTMSWIDNLELTPITYQEWFDDNQGYVNKTTKAYDYENDVDWDELEDFETDIPF